jgi:SnoaL-like domain
MKRTDNTSKVVSRRQLLQNGLVVAPAIGTALAAGSLSSQALAAPRTGKSRISVEDRLDLIDMHAQYSWSYDCADSDGAASVFAPDGVLEAFGTEAARGRVAIAAFIKNLLGTEKGAVDWQHNNSHFVFHGSRPNCTVYCYWNLLESSDPPRKYSVRSFGYYKSDCVRVNGSWLITKRSINRWDRNKLPWA